MGQNVTQKLIESHLLEGDLRRSELDLGIRIDQTLMQDATGTLVMLELEAMGIDRVTPEISVQYVDHNILQEDGKNAEDHAFLRSACQRFGIGYSGPGNGVSHPLHQEWFGKPGKTLLGSDSHTCAAGALGMLAIGVGGIEVATVMAGQPYWMPMPRIRGVKLVGRLPDWVSAKDIILEMLRRHGMEGGLGQVIEYYGPGLAGLSAMDRHVIANMGAELGATTSVFPSDQRTFEYLEDQNRAEDWISLEADSGASYDLSEELDLSRLEPLMAMPSHPGNVVPVREVKGKPIYQSYIGSSANPGFRDFAVVAEILKGKKIAGHVSFDVNPTSRQLLEDLIESGHLQHLIHAGARLHQAGCNGCIGMGQAPISGKLSLRTVPRNFQNRSGTKDDQVCLVSPETAAASALHGVIFDPRELGMAYPHIEIRKRHSRQLKDLIEKPLESDEARKVKLEKGPNIRSLPELEALPQDLEIRVALQVGNDISTDAILPAGSQVLPFRSNIQAISKFCFRDLDPEYVTRAQDLIYKQKQEHAIIAGRNYGQGSSREHAALAPRVMGLRVVIARSMARIHERNLVNFGVLPLLIPEESMEALSKVELNDLLIFSDIRSQLRRGGGIEALHRVTGTQILLRHSLSERQVETVIEGGLMNLIRSQTNIKKAG